jgi:D-sedoheptulose 7-phosphate isomerase
MSDNRVRQIFTDAATAHLAAADRSVESILAAAEMMIQSLERGGKVLVFGNGGSASDAQHFAAELVGRFQIERLAMAALALTTDTSVLTGIANDYTYERVFSRQLEALGRPPDVAFAITTSGRSHNVLAALRQARQQGLATVALVGSDPALLEDLADVVIPVHATGTARIQEVHRTALHALCELIESSHVARPTRETDAALRGVWVED